MGNHSYEHEPWLHRYERGRLDEEFARTEDALVAAGAPRPRGFRGPGYSLSPTLVELLDDRGYTYDASTLPTWIGPLARAYYFRSSPLSPRSEPSGRTCSAVPPRGCARASVPMAHSGTPAAALLELPVTTMPLLRVPVHVSYLLHLHQMSPKRLARTSRWR